MEQFSDSIAKATEKGSPDITGHAIVAAVIDKDGNSLYQKSSGHTSPSHDAELITADHVFFIASCTKLVTAIASLQCVEQGFITLDEPVEKWLPELAEQPVVSLNEGEDKDSNPFILTPQNTKITLRHLLTHSSGAVYDQSSGSPALEAWFKATGVKPTEMVGDMMKVLDRPLAFQPGTEWMYGRGLDWAGILIRRLTNMSLEAYFDKNIYKPLNLTSTTFNIDQHPELEKKFVSVTQRNADGRLEKVNYPSGKTDIERGGSGLYASVNDYMRVLADIISPTPKLLSLSSAELLFAPQFPADSGPLKHLYKNEIYFSISSPGMVSKMGVSINQSISAVLYETEVPSSRMPPGTIGWGGLPNQLWWANRDVGIAAFIAHSVIPPADPKCTRLSVEFQQAVWKLVKERKG